MEVPACLPHQKNSKRIERRITYLTAFGMNCVSREMLLAAKQTIFLDRGKDRGNVHYCLVWSNKYNNVHIGKR